MENVKVQYLRSYSPYVTGDITAVDADKAKVLIEAGIVKAFDAPTKNKMVAAPIKKKAVKAKK